MGMMVPPRTCPGAPVVALGVPFYVNVVKTVLAMLQCNKFDVSNDQFGSANFIKRSACAGQNLEKRRCLREIIFGTKIANNGSAGRIQGKSGEKA
jgi:hypothetical protein